MQIAAISFLYPSSSKIIFTKAPKCVVQRDSGLKKSDKCFFFSLKIGYKDETWCISLINGSMFGPQGGVYRDFFAFKAFKECLPQFHSTQFSPLHHAYKFFSI